MAKTSIEKKVEENKINSLRVLFIETVHLENKDQALVRVFETMEEFMKPESDGANLSRRLNRVANEFVSIEPSKNMISFYNFINVVRSQIDQGSTAPYNPITANKKLGGGVIVVQPTTPKAGNKQNGVEGCMTDDCIQARILEQAKQRLAAKAAKVKSENEAKALLAEQEKVSRLEKIKEDNELAEKKRKEQELLEKSMADDGNVVATSLDAGLMAGMPLNEDEVVVKPGMNETVIVGEENTPTDKDTQIVANIESADETSTVKSADQFEPKQPEPSPGNITPDMIEAEREVVLKEINQKILEITHPVEISGLFFSDTSQMVAWLDNFPEVEDKYNDKMGIMELSKIIMNNKHLITPEETI